VKKLTLADTPGRLARMWSIWLSVSLAMLSAAQADVLPLVAPLVPPERWPWVSGGLAMAIVVARGIKQQLPDPPAPPAPPTPPTGAAP
jgi:hypothetical protein